MEMAMTTKIRVVQNKGITALGGDILRMTLKICNGSE